MWRSAPHHFVREDPMSKPPISLDGKTCAIGDTPFVDRRVRPDHDVAHDRMHAIGADNSIGAGRAAILEAQRHASRRT
jgi:hypothetical protein